MTLAGQTLLVRRMVALGCLAVMLIGLCGIAVAPFLLAGTIAEDIEARGELVALLERRAADRDRLKSEQARLSASGQSPRALLEGETFGLASAHLQKLLVDNVQSAGLTLRSIQALEPSLEVDLTVVPVRMVMRGNIDGLRALLHTLETSEPLLFVDEVVVKSDRPGIDDGSRQGPVELGVELKVSGYVAGRKAP